MTVRKRGPFALWAIISITSLTLTHGWMINRAPESSTGRIAIMNMKTARLCFCSASSALHLSVDTSVPSEATFDNDSNDESVQTYGRVIRLAAKPFHQEHSKPSSQSYTTSKIACESLAIDTDGCGNDYNHYRSLALNNTLYRAVSILTVDCMRLCTRNGYPVEAGDLGENILVDNVAFTFFAPGNVYRITSNGDDSEVILEITEAMDPCGNLCKLPYINDPTKTPAQRVKQCQDLLALLDQQPGLRGWYGKVLQTGTIDKSSRIYAV